MLKLVYGQLKILCHLGKTGHYTGMVYQQKIHLTSKVIMSRQNLIKLTLAILLFGCLANMPYGYHQLVRFS